MLPLHRLAPNHHHTASADHGDVSSTAAAADPEGLPAEPPPAAVEDLGLRATDAARSLPLGGHGTLWTLSMAHLPYGSAWLWCVG